MPKRRIARVSDPATVGSIIAEKLQSVVEHGGGFDICVSISPKEQKTVVFEVPPHGLFRLTGDRQDVVAQTIHHLAQKLMEPVQQRKDLAFEKVGEITGKFVDLVESLANSMKKDDSE